MNSFNQHYLYGIVDRHDTGLVAADRMIGPGPLAFKRFGSLAVLTSPVSVSPIEPKRRDLKAHAHVLEVAMQDRTLLPMRFGIIAEDLSQIGAALEKAETHLQGLLKQFADQVEYGVRISWDRDRELRAILRERPDLVATQARLAARGEAGRYDMIAFGRQVAELFEARRAAAEAVLLERMSFLLTDHRIKQPEMEDEVFRADVLVARQSEDAFAVAVDAAAQAIGATVKLVGPAPVYSFLTVQLDLSVVPMGAE
ncbi:MAG: GvpL/GvpF family gas vesicle protein [Pseudomonadota bacterium]